MTRHNVTVEDSSPLVVYENYSLWQDSPHDDANYFEYSGPSSGFNSFHITNVSTSVDLPFNGTGIYVFGSVGPTHGDFTVTLTPNDTLRYTGGPSFLNTQSPEVTHATGFNAASYSFQRLLFSRTGLDQSVPHFITITNSGQGQFILDYFVVESDLGQSSSSVNEITLDDTHPAFTYPTGSWNTDLSNLKNSSSGQNFLQLFNNQTQHGTSDADAQASLTFRGSGVTLHGTWFYGSFDAHVDNHAVIPVKSSKNGTELNSYNRPREMIFAVDGLDEGTHTVMLTNGKPGLTIDYAVVSTTDPQNLDGVPQPAVGGKSTDLKPIIGGAVGGFVLLVLITVALWVWRRRRQRRVHERVDLMSDADTASVRRANSWVPWRPPSTRAGESGSHLQGVVAMSSASGLAEMSQNESASGLVTSQNMSSASPFTSHPGTPNGGSENHSSGPPVAVINPTPRSARSPRSGKQQRAREQAPERVPRHEADAGVTLQRAGTAASTLPPLYDDQWNRDREVHS